MTKGIIEAVLDEPILLATVIEDPEPLGFWQRLKIKLGLDLPVPPIERSLYIKGATASTMYKITELLLSIKQTSELKDYEGQLYDLMNANIDHVVRFLAIAIHNAKGNPPESLLLILNNNFTIEQLKAMASVAYGRLGILSFFGIMGLLRNPDLRMTVTQDPIAHGQPLEDTSNTSEAAYKHGIT